MGCVLELLTQKFGDDKTPEDLVIDLSSMNTKGKEWFKDYNQRFSYLKNRIPNTVLPVEKLLVAYYIKGLPTQIAMWVKRARKEYLQDAFFEAIQVERDMLYLKYNPDSTSKQAPTSCRKTDGSLKPANTSQCPFNMSDMKKLLQRMSNKMVDLKKTNNENQSNNRGFNRPPFRRPNQPPQNPPAPNPNEGFTS